MKRYPSTGIGMLALAVGPVLLALAALVLGDGDLFAVVEFNSDARTRPGAPAVLAYPAWVVIVCALAVAAALVVAGLAYLLGSLGILTVSAVFGAAAGIATMVVGGQYALANEARWTAHSLGAVVLLFAVGTTISMFVERRKVRIEQHLHSPII